MIEFIKFALAIAFLLIIWKGLRTIAKAIDYLANMKGNHEEIADLLQEIRDELKELNKNKLNNDNVQ